MTVSGKSLGTAASGTTSCTPSYPASIAANDLLILVTCSKYKQPTSVTGSWTLLASHNAGAGSSGADSGQAYLSVYYKMATGSESGTITVSVSGGNCVVARIGCFDWNKTGNLELATAQGGDTTSGTAWSVTTGTLEMKPNDFIFAFSAGNSDATMTSHGLSASGITFGSVVERIDNGTSSGDNCNIFGADARVSSGSGTVAVTYTATASISHTNDLCGPTIIMRARDNYSLVLDPLAINVALPSLNGLFHNYSLALSTLALSVALPNINLAQTYKLSLSTLALSVALPNISLNKGYYLGLDPLALSVALPDVTLKASYQMVLDPLALAVTMADVGINKQYQLALDPLAFSVSMDDIILKVSRVLTLDPLALAVTLNDVGLLRQYRLTVSPLAISVALGDVVLTHTLAPAGDLSGAMVAQVVAPELRPILLFEGEFDTGIVRFWTGYGELTWNEDVWYGSGAIISVSPIQQTNDIRASGATVTLSAISLETIALALVEAKQGKRGTVWLAVLNEAGEIVADPVILFRGKLDVPEIEDTGEDCKLNIAYESRLIDFERSRERRYTPEDQAIDYPGDKGFDEVARLQDLKIVWGYPIK